MTLYSVAFLVNCDDAVENMEVQVWRHPVVSSTEFCGLCCVQFCYLNVVY